MVPAPIKTVTNKMSCGRPDCRKKFVTLAGRSKHINHNESCRKWWLLRIVSRKVERPPYETSSEIASDEECFRLDESENLMMENGNPFSITDLHDDSSLLRENHCTLERGTSPAVISGIDIITEEYNGAAKVIGKDKNLFDQLWDNDEYYERRNAGCPYYPFSGPVEWELVQWLQSLDIPMNKLDKFFTLNYVKDRPLSFSSAQDMRARIELLPGPPRWRETDVVVRGGVTKKPLTLYYRDGLECFRFLFGNPLFSNHMDFIPRREYTSNDKMERLYNDIMTGDNAWKLQEEINLGETLGLVLLSSDKTHLTVGQGDKECHAVYMSCGNIKKEIRAKVDAHCWMMIAQIPIAKFEHPKHQVLLTNRLLHRCLDIILDGLKSCAASAVQMSDPAGQIRLVRTFLAAYIADLPEQQALACVRTGYAPSSVAGPTTLGSSGAQDLRYGTDTIQTILEVQEELGTENAEDDLNRVKKLYGLRNLNGVNKPFWRNWLLADPSSFLTPDSLHQWHKLFMDHPVEWAKAWLGNEELDRRISVLQPRVGFRHFGNGFTRFRQHTGKETKDIERVFLCIIAGHENVTEGIMKAMRALLDFIYLAQYKSHSTVTLEYLEDALRSFHYYKRYISESGVRSGLQKKDEFNIPKIELMQHVKRLIKLHGSAPQYSSEQTERCHIDMAKHPYKATNRKDYAEQMCRYLDRHERVRLFSTLTVWRLARDEATNIDDPSEYQHILSHLSPFQRVTGALRQSACDIFNARANLCSKTTAFRLRDVPNMQGAFPLNIQCLYQIPNFQDDLRKYFLGRRAKAGISLPFNTIDIWWQVRMQLRDPQDSEMVLPPLTVQAKPPTNEETVGRYNFIILHGKTQADDLHEEFELGPTERAYDHIGVQGCKIAQLKVIFSLNLPHTARDSTSSGSGPGHRFFAYVQPFRLAANSKGQADMDILMYRLVRDVRSNNIRKGIIVPLEDIWRPADLVPRFKKACPIDWTCDTAVECSKEFYLNCFTDKATYHEVY